MNTLFVLLMWGAVYYLFFHPLNESEYVHYVMDWTYREFAEGYNVTNQQG